MKNPVILWIVATQLTLSCSTTKQANDQSAKTNISNFKNDVGNPADSVQEKANINTSRSNIKKGVQRPPDSLQQKANHNTARSNKSTIKGDGGNSIDSVQEKANINTSRSNIKKGVQRPPDSLQQKANHNTARSNKSTIKGDGGNSIDSVQEKANINTSRSNIKKGLQRPSDSLQQKANHNTARSNKSTIKGDGEEVADNLQTISGYDYTHRLTRGTNSVKAMEGGKEGLATCSMIYIGGGFTGLNNSTKEKTHLADTKDINIGVYLPVIKKLKTSYGINMEMEYRFNNNVIPSLPKPFLVEGEVSPNVTLVNENDLSQSAYTFAAGPQIQFILGKAFLISPMLHAGYMHMKQHAFDARQTINNGRENYTFILHGQPGNKYNLYFVKPAIRLQYLLMERFGLWVETNYQTSSTLKISYQQFFPEGKANPDGSYTFSQIQNGTSKELISNTKFNAGGFKLGMAFKLNKGKEVKFKAGAELSDKVN